MRVSALWQYAQMHARCEIDSCIMAKSEWNVETLKEDIKKYTKRKEELVTTIKKMEEAKINADEVLRNIPDEDNVWKQRYLEKQEENMRLQKDLNSFIKPRQETESTTTIADPDQEGSVTTLDNMSDLALRQLQRKLEKDRTEMEWKLKEYGWRLDQASAALCRAEEEKQAILTQIGHAVVKLKDVQKAGEVKKCHSTNL